MARSDPPAQTSDRDAEGGFWHEYWDRFRRQQVDDPVEDRQEGYWDRFKRQQVDDPVDTRGRRGR